MSYEKQNWIDHIEDSETGEIFQEGTLFTAKRMNHIEEGIYECSSKVKDVDDKKLTFQNESIGDLYYIINSNIAGDSGSDTGKLSISTDGENFNYVKTINNWTACTSIIHKNGYFYKMDACKNGDEYQYDFILSYSKNLMDWTSKKISTGLKETTIKSYGGDLFEDDNGDIYIVLTLCDGTDESQVNNEHFALYIMKLDITDIDTYTFIDFRKLVLDNKNRIDGSLFKKDNLYYLCAKTEVEGKIEIWTSTDLTNWTYKCNIPVFDISTGYKFEAPCMTYYNGKYIIYADDFGGTYVTETYNGGMVFTTTTDFETFTTPKVINREPDSVRHATVRKAKNSEEYQIVNTLATSNGINKAIEASDSRFVNITDRLSNETLKLLSNNNYVYRIYDSCTISNLSNINASYFDILMIGDISVTLKSSDSLQLPNGVSELVLNTDYGFGTKIIRFTRVDKCYYTDILNTYTLKENILRTVSSRTTKIYESGNSHNITFSAKCANGLIMLKGHSNYTDKDRAIFAGISILNGSANLFNFASDTKQITLSSFTYTDNTYTFNLDVGYEYSVIDIELPMTSKFI